MLLNESIPSNDAGLRQAPKSSLHRKRLFRLRPADPALRTTSRLCFVQNWTYVLLVDSQVLFFIVKDICD